MILTYLGFVTYEVASHAGIWLENRGFYVICVTCVYACFVQSYFVYSLLLDLAFFFIVKCWILSLCAYYFDLFLGCTLVRPKHAWSGKHIIQVKGCSILYLHISCVSSRSFPAALSVLVFHGDVLFSTNLRRRHMKQLITPKNKQQSKCVKFGLGCTTAFASELKTLALLYHVSCLLIGEARRTNFSSLKHANVGLFFSRGFSLVALSCYRRHSP